MKQAMYYLSCSAIYTLSAIVSFVVAAYMGSTEPWPYSLTWFLTLLGAACGMEWKASELLERSREAFRKAGHVVRW